MPGKNPWLSFLKAYKAKNPGKSMKQSMKDGAVEYRKSKKGGTDKAKKVKKKTKGKKKKSK